MEIKHDQSYLANNEGMVNAGLINDVVGKICIQGNYKLQEQKLVKQIADYLEETYRMYQYVKDNGVAYKTEELFFWTNERENMLYFDVTVKADTLERHNQIVNEIIDYLETNYFNSGIYVRLQYSSRYDWNKINEYLKQGFDLNNLSFEVLTHLYNESRYVGRNFTEESLNKLQQLSALYLDQFLDKKVTWNNLKGTVRKLGDKYAFFKIRATKTYYPIDLGNVQSLQLR